LESENIQFHMQVREGFLKVRDKNHKRFKEIDARDSVEQIFKAVAAHVNCLIAQKNSI